MVFAYIYLLITIVQLRTSLCIAVVADDAFSTNVNMVFSADDRILIENLYKFKNYGAKRLIQKFPTKGWSVSSVNKLLKKLRDTGITARRTRSGPPQSARIDDNNVDSVEELVLSQEGAPETYRSTRQIARETGVHHSSVYRIVRQDLELKCLKKCCAQELTAANCTSRLIQAKKLLHLFLASIVDFIFFTDEIFSVVAPTNLQNDRVYVPATMKKGKTPA